MKSCVNTKMNSALLRILTPDCHQLNEKLHFFTLWEGWFEVELSLEERIRFQETANWLKAAHSLPYYSTLHHVLSCSYCKESADEFRQRSHPDLWMLGNQINSPRETFDNHQKDALTTDQIFYFELLSEKLKPFSYGNTAIEQRKEPSSPRIKKYWVISLLLFSQLFWIGVCWSFYFKYQQIKENVNDQNKGTPLTINPSIQQPLAKVEIPPGTILPYSGNLSRIPDGFLLCNGSLISQFQYPDLVAYLEKIDESLIEPSFHEEKIARLPDFRERTLFFKSPLLSSKNQNTSTWQQRHFLITQAHQAALLEDTPDKTPLLAHHHPIRLQEELIPKNLFSGKETFSTKENKSFYYLIKY